MTITIVMKVVKCRTNLQIVEVDENEWMEQGRIHPEGDQSGKLLYLPSIIG